MAPMTHKEWLESMKAQQQEHYRRCGLATALPTAPTTWAEPPAAPSFPGMASETFEASFAGISLDGGDFDVPVYRGLSDVFSSDSSSFSEADDYFEERPVYRGIDMSLFADASPPQAAPPPMSMSMEEADRLWLESMPPLIHRQHARGASLAVGA